MQSILRFLNSVWPYALALVAFLFLIVIHEFGHFIAAKLLGVRVNEFAVGFGPKILHKKGKETQYSLRLVPLGGYCAMEGEDEESADEMAFCKKAPWRRFLIVLMGATFNIIFGIILVGVTLLPHKTFTTTTVAGFSETAKSNQGEGLMVGDKILEVDGRKIYTTYDLSYNFSAVDDGNLDIKVLRNGEKKELNNVTFKTGELEGYKVIEVDFWVKGEKSTPATFISQTIKTSFSYSRIVVFSLIDMFKGRYKIADISGPVGVTDAIGQAAKTSAMDLIGVMALITINLGIMNLLPIPALDGGRILFILIEMIFKKPVPQKYEKWVHAIGLFILLIFMAAITLKDIWVRII